MSDLKVLDRKFGEYAEGKFTMIEQMERTYDYDVSDSIKKLLELKGQGDNIPAQIERLNDNKSKIEKFYKEGLDLLKEADKKYNLELNFEELGLV